MSNLFLSVVYLFKSVGYSFSGRYSNDNPEIKQIMNELFSAKTSTAKIDRSNLHNDGVNVANDFKNVFRLKSKL